jgi:hypothetical protein
VQDDTQEGIVDLKSTIVPNEPQFPEFIHEKVNARARCANHFRQHLLGYAEKHLLRWRFLPIASEQQKRPSQAFLAGIEKLIDQILLDSDVPRKNVGHEAVGEGMFCVKRAQHFVFFYE